MVRSMLAALALVAGALSLSALTPPPADAAEATCLTARDWRAACSVHDLNADCTLTSADVAIINQIIVGQPVTLPTGTTADVSGDGIVSSVDAFLLSQLIYRYGINGTVVVLC